MFNDNQQIPASDDFLSFSRKEALESVKLSKWFKIHAVIAILFSIICTIIWMFVAFVDDEGVPWFIYPAAASCMSLSFHFYYFIRPKEVFQIHVVWFVVLNCVLFTTWVAGQHTRTWFIYPLFGFGALLLIHYNLVANKNNEHQLIKLHTHLFIVANLAAFLIWLDSSYTHPWFIYAFFGLGLMLVTHYCFHYYPGDYFTLHLYIFADAQLLFFFAWAAFGAKFPWFIFPLALWSIVLALHYKFGPSAKSSYNNEPEFSANPSSKIDDDPQHGFAEYPTKFESQV